VLGPVRPGPAEAARLAAIARAAFQDRGRGWEAPELLAFAARPGALILADGALSDGALLLQVAGGEAEILDFGVVPARRRHGLGRRLLDSAHFFAREAGAGRMVLEVAADNAPARALYAAAGYSQAGCRRGYYRRRDGSRADALILARPLAEPVPEG
jgi:ribosomal-protein-alanine N-acetyltransferase